MTITTVAYSATIPSTTAIFAGAGDSHVFSLQPDCDCYIQFVQADLTPLSGKIHVKQYEIYTVSGQGDGILVTTGGLKIITSGNTSGSVNGFFTINN
jgi:hypothetical protein